MSPTLRFIWLGTRDHHRHHPTHTDRNREVHPINPWPQSPGSVRLRTHRSLERIHDHHCHHPTPLPTPDFENSLHTPHLLPSSPTPCRESEGPPWTTTTTINTTGGTWWGFGGTLRTSFRGHHHHHRLTYPGRSLEIFLTGLRSRPPVPSR